MSLQKNNYDTPRKEIFLVAGLILITFFLFFFQLGNLGLLEPDEGRYAEIPRKMIETGDYIVPRLNSVLYFEKPPFVYWMVALSFKFLGYNELAARFSIALLGALGIILTYFLARKMYGIKCGIFSAFILLASLEYFFVGRILILDMPLAFFMTLSFSSFYFALHAENKKGLWLILFYISLALGVLTKGPVAFVLPAGLTFLYLILTGRFMRFCKDRMHLWGLLIFLALTLPWFILVIHREPSFFHFFFIREHVLRFLTSEHNRGQPFYYFFLVLLVGFFPWVMYLPFAFRRFLKIFPLGIWKNEDNHAFMYLFLWSVGILTFFSLSGSKLVAYIVPIFPALAIMVGRLMSDESFSSDTSPKESMALFSLISVLVLAFVSFAAYYALGRHKLEGVTMVIVLIIVLLLGGFGLSCYLFFVRKNKNASFVVQIGSILFLQLIVIVGFQKAESYLSSRDIMMTLKNVKQPGDIVFTVGCYEQSMPFYLQERVQIVDWVGELAFGMGKLPEEEKEKWFPKGRYDFLINEFKKKNRVFAVINEDDFQDFSRHYPDIKAYVLASAHETVLISNREKIEGRGEKVKSGKWKIENGE